MSKELVIFHTYHPHTSTRASNLLNIKAKLDTSNKELSFWRQRPSVVLVPTYRQRVLPSVAMAAASGGVPQPPLDLTEDNIRLVLDDARVELGQIFDTSVGITGQVELAELDGPFVKISLKGRFWHKRSTVVARVGNYLKQRIPEILEVEIEDDKQLDDSPASF